MLRRVGPSTFAGLVKSVARKAAEGCRVSDGPHGVTVNCSGDCEQPLPCSYELVGSFVETQYIKQIPWPDEPSGWLFYERFASTGKPWRDMEGKTICFRFRCRECVPCQKVRALS